MPIYSQHIAVLIASYNRKIITSNCINNLSLISPNLDIYLVDDNSLDKTGEFISKFFPQVNVSYGRGDLYWNRAMHKCWTIAALKDYDYYLWLNDDVTLYDNFLEELLYCSSIQNNESIISGIIENIDKNKVLYGGSDKYKNLLIPNNKTQAIYYLNGNCVLIPKIVFYKIGNFDPLFHHDLGDVDYGLRALKSNINILTTRVVIGSCIENNICRVRKNSTTLINRFKILYSPLGSPPRLNFYFRKQHFGLINAFIYFIFLHFINLIPDFLNKALFKKRYS